MLEYVIKDISDIRDNDYKLSFLYMSDSRKAKTERLQNALSKQHTLAGEWLVRSLLFKITGKDMDSFIINTYENGKPYLENSDGLFFNISHSQNKIAVAVSDKEIGIDIETFRPIDIKLAKRVCTPDELIYIFGHIPEDADYDESANLHYVRRFLEIWTLKEAYLKCLGTGITGFESFTLPDEDFEKIKIVDEDYIVHIVKK